MIYNNLNTPLTGNFDFQQSEQSAQKAEVLAWEPKG